MKKLICALLVCLLLCPAALAVWTEKDMGGQVESKWQYRWRQKETISSTSSTMDGWTLDYSTAGAWGSWVSNGKTSISATTDREVTTISHAAVTKTTYSYRRYYYYHSGAGSYYSSYSSTWATSQGYSGSWQYKTVDSPLAKYNKYDGVQSYGGSGNIWFYETANTSTVTEAYTEYQYRTRSRTYYFYRWGEWTDWSDTQDWPDDDDVEVTSRQVYQSTYTIQFDAGQGTGAPEDAQKVYGEAITLPTAEPTYEGHLLDGWRRADDPEGTIYEPGDTYAEEGDVTLQAVWSVEHYIIWFDAQGGEGAPGFLTKTYGEDMTIPEAAPTKEGCAFYGWVDDKENPTTYQPGDPYTANEPAHLTAMWGAATYTVTFDDNGGNGGPVNGGKLHNVAMAIPDTVPTRQNYDFVGWAESADAGEPDYLPGDSYTANEDITLYALWTLKRYTITYNANGGVDAPEPQIKVFGTALRVTYDVPTREGYDFDGWGTSSTATKATWQPGSSLSRNSDLTLYAVWAPTVYIITYDANGGTGAPESFVKYYGSAATLSAIEPVWEGYTFQGWALTSDASAAAYAPGGSFDENEDATLYAVWQENLPAAGFDAAVNGYAFGNTASSFGYGSNGTGENYPIKMSVFQLVFGDTVTARSKWKANTLAPWGGNCCGMSATAGLLFDGTVSISGYGKGTTHDLSVNDVSSGLSVKTFIEAMQIAQWSESFSREMAVNKVYTYQLEADSTGKLTALANAVSGAAASGHGTIIAVQKSGVGGHALLGYGVEQVSDTEWDLLVYDCNYPGVRRAITLTVNGSQVTGWRYDMGGYGLWGSNVAGGNGCTISYVSHSTISGIWARRGSLNESMNLLTFEGGSLSITDEYGAEVARVENGELVSSRSGVYPLEDLSMSGGGVEGLFLPEAFYTVYGADGQELTMTSGNLGATVTSTTDAVSFLVDESSLDNTVILENASESDSYTVYLECSLGNVQLQNAAISGQGLGSSISISAGGALLSIVGNGAIDSLQINGVEQVSCVITSGAMAGGSITPAGDTAVTVGGSQTYVITPDPDYSISSVRIDGADVGVIDSYTFSNVAARHTIFAYFTANYHLTNASLSGHELTVSLINQGDAMLICAAYAPDGSMIAARTVAAPQSCGTRRLTLGDWPAGTALKVMLVDGDLKPLCEPLELTM